MDVRVQNSYEEAVSASRRLGVAYAAVLRAVESPLPISRYAALLSERHDTSPFEFGLFGALALAALVCICVVAFRPPLPQIIDTTVYLLFAVVALTLLNTKRSRKVLGPLVVRALTIDYVVKVMVHTHVRRHMITLDRQYTVIAFALHKGDAEKEQLGEVAEAYGKLTQKLYSLRAILYVSAPPLLGGVISQVNWKGIFAAAPVWLLSLSLLYVFYLTNFCFARKREILLGKAHWLSSRPLEEIYVLEDAAYAAIDVTKKRELPLDLILWAINGVVIVLVEAWLLTHGGSSLGGGIVGQLGGGAFYDSIIPLVAALTCFWFSAKEWKERCACGRA